jgi:FkbM family methyltransferase
MKDKIKKIVIRKSIILRFMEFFVNYSKGIGYVPSLETEVMYLVNNNSKEFVLFDIGANIGDYSIMVSRKYPRSRIYSFEPSKYTYKLLTDNVDQETRIKPFNLAFGEDNTKMKLYSNLEGSGMASFYQRDLEYASINFNQSEIVDVVTLDNWVNLNNIIPDYIKIDVEGSELSVLTGGINTLRHVKAVQFEFGGTAIDARKYFRDYWNLFKEMDFSIYRYTPGGPMQITQYSEKEERFEYMNYVAVSNKKNQ